MTLATGAANRTVAVLEPQAWLGEFRRALKARFHRYYPDGWTYLFDTVDGDFLIDGGEGRAMRETIAIGEGYPAAAAERFLAWTFRHAVAMGWLPAEQRPTRAYWHVPKAARRDLTIATLICPEGHMVLSASVSSGAARCRACGRDYDIE